MQFYSEKVSFLKQNPFLSGDLEPGILSFTWNSFQTFSKTSCGIIQDLFSSSVL